MTALAEEPSITVCKKTRPAQRGVNALCEGICVRNRSLIELPETLLYPEA